MLWHHYTPIFCCGKRCVVVTREPTRGSPGPGSGVEGADSSQGELNHVIQDFKLGLPAALSYDTLGDLKSSDRNKVLTQPSKVFLRQQIPSLQHAVREPSRSSFSATLIKLL